MTDITIGVIGYGYWGPNVVRNFFSIDNCRIKSVADERSERLTMLAKNFPSIAGVNIAKDIINDSAINAVVIATPVFSHFDLAKKALENGKHVLIEKPLASTVAESEELINLAERKGLTLMVDHTFLYTGAVQKMKELIDSGFIGIPRYFDSSRINLGLFQSDINVLWDLAAHDISILLYLIKDIPESVNATGISHTHNEVENIAYMTVNYNSDFIAHINSSWTLPVIVPLTQGSWYQFVFIGDYSSRLYEVRMFDWNEKQVIFQQKRWGDVDGNVISYSYIPKLSEFHMMKPVQVNKKKKKNLCGYVMLFKKTGTNDGVAVAP